VKKATPIQTPIETKKPKAKKVAEIQTSVEEKPGLALQPPVQTKRPKVKKATPVETPVQTKKPKVKKATPIQTPPEAKQPQVEKATPIQTPAESNKPEVKKAAPIQTPAESKKPDTKKAAPKSAEQQTRSSPAKTAQQMKGPLPDTHILRPNAGHDILIAYTFVIILMVVSLRLFLRPGQRSPVPGDNALYVDTDFEAHANDGIEDTGLINDH
jgi:hypothetical protein